MKIYCIKNPYTNKIVYVGKTKQSLHIRLIEHCYEVYHRKRNFAFLKQQWFDRFIKNGILPKIELIEECDENIVNSREKYWIKFYNPILNVVYANNLKQLENISRIKSIPIFQYNKQGEFIKEWKSITEAANFLKIEGGNISAAAIGRRKLAGIWMWGYEKVEFLKPYKINTFKKEVHQYDIDGNYIQSFECARSVPNVKFKLISKCCNGNLKSVYGFRYSFIKYNKLEKIVRKVRKDKNISRYSPILEEILEK